MGHWPAQIRQTARRLTARFPVVALPLLATATAATAVALGTYLGSGSTTGDPVGETPAVEDRVGSRFSLTDGVRERGLYSLPYDSSTPAPTQAPPETPTPTPASHPFAWPAKSWIAQGMTPTHPGIDIAVGVGEPVRAVRAGKVKYAGGDGCCSYGHFVIVQHDKGWTSLYGHLSRFGVAQGDDVVQGQVIGLAGNTGRLDGPHLHFELRSFGAPVNPLHYLPHGDEIAVPVEVAATPAQSASASQARPQDPPAPPPSPTKAGPSSATGTTVAAEEAIAIAVEWLADQAELVYTLDTQACTATRTGPNWFVTCEAGVRGCQGAVCYSTLTACVFEPELLVASSCP